MGMGDHGKYIREHFVISPDVLALEPAMKNYRNMMNNFGYLGSLELKL